MAGRKIKIRSSLCCSVNSTEDLHFLEANVFISAVIKITVLLCSFGTRYLMAAAFCYWLNQSHRGTGYIRQLHKNAIRKSNFLMDLGKIFKSTHVKLFA